MTITMNQIIEAFGIPTIWRLNHLKYPRRESKSRIDRCVLLVENYEMLLIYWTVLNASFEFCSNAP